MRNRERIVVDARMISQDQCHGIGRVVIEFVKRFPTAGDTDLIVLLAEGRPSKFDVGPLRDTAEVVYTSSPVGRPYDVVDLWRILKRLDAKVIFAPYHALAPMAVPCRLVVGVHDCIMEGDIRLAGGRARSAAYRANTARVLRSAAAVVVPSESTRALLPACYKHVPPVYVCPNGVDPNSWTSTPADQQEAREVLDLPERFVLSVGARRPHKNQGVLVKALREADADFGLVLLGDHDPRVPDEVSDLVQDLGVSSRVRQLSQLRDSQMRGLYGSAEIFAFPSIAEGFGLPPLEAMSAGVPVVASAVPAVAEVCRDAAIYVSPYSPEHWASAISDLLSSTDLQMRLRARGKQVVAEASWDRGAKRLFEVLKGIAEMGSAA